MNYGQIIENKKISKLKKSTVIISLEMKMKIKKKICLMLLIGMVNIVNYKMINVQKKNNLRI